MLLPHDQIVEGLCFRREIGPVGRGGGEGKARITHRHACLVFQDEQLEEGSDQEESTVEEQDGQKENGQG